MIVVFNKKPDIYKKQSVDNESGSKPIFDREEIRMINRAWNDCPFTQEHLERFFNIEGLRKKVKTTTFLIDVNEKMEG